MNLYLHNKIAFVSGASSGIGAAVARVFAEEGADVVVGYHHNQSGAEDTARQIRALRQQTCICAMDQADPASIAAAIAALPPELAQFDALVLCAGENIVTPWQDISPAEWRKVLDVNLSGPFFLAQALAPHLRENAAVVLVSSVAAQTGNPNHIHYAAAKAGLVNLTKSLARALAPRVRVNCVAPGITRTAMGTATVAPDYPRKNLLMPRFAEPDEMARCIVFVASPIAAFMTGATVDINGGRLLR